MWKCEFDVNYTYFMFKKTINLGGDPRRPGTNWFARAWGAACVPFARLKVAVDEGAPLVVHGAFALACLVLQRTMSRNCPEGLLRRVSIPPIAVPFSLGG